MTTPLYDPLTYKNLMLGLTMRFEQQPTVDLDSESAIASIQGPGIYSLHYCGDLSFYGPIGDGKKPIYVGKAVPPGSRKGGELDPDAPALRGRIKGTPAVNPVRRKPGLPRFRRAIPRRRASLDYACGAIPC